MRRLLLMLMFLPWQWSMATELTIPWQYGFDKTNKFIALAGSTYAAHGIFTNGSQVIISASNQVVRVYDFRGDLLNAVTTPFTNAYPAGHYFIETEGDRFNFTVLPTNYGQPGVMGVHSTGSTAIHSTLNDALYPYWERTGGNWGLIETNKNVYDWYIVDHYLGALTNRNRAMVVYEGMGTIPAWLRAETNGVNFETWMTNVVERYTNHMQNVFNRWPDAPIDVWEPQNEPGVHQYYVPVVEWRTQANKEFMVNLIVDYVKRWRDANRPTMKIAAPSWAGLLYEVTHSNIVARFSPNIKDFTDIWTWHRYPMSHPLDEHINPTPSEEGLATTYIGPDVGDKRIFIGEYGLAAMSALGLQSQTNSAADCDSLGVPWWRGVWNGAKLVTIYKQFGDDVGIVLHLGGAAAYTAAGNACDTFGFEQGGGLAVEGTRGPHPKTSAFMFTARALEGSTFISKNTNGVLRAYTFTVGGATQTVAWATQGNTTNIAAFGDIAMDVYGNPVTYGGALTEEPLFFRHDTNASPVFGSGGTLTFTNTVDIVTHTTNYFNVWQTNTVTQVVPCPSVKTTMVTRAELDSIPGIGKTLGQRVKDRLDNWGYRR